MRVAVCMVFFVSSIALVQADAGDAVKSLEGDYVLKEMAKGGKVAPREIVDSFEGVTIAAGSMTLKSNGETKTAKITVDASQKPATIDLQPTTGPEEGKTLPGIFKLEKGSLTLVFTGPGKRRPANFDATGADEIRVILERKAK